MRIPPFDSSRRDESNGGIPILPRPLNAELIDKISLNRCFSTAPFDVSSNISTSSGHRRMGIPPFEPACRDESNGGRFISIRPLDAKLIGEMSSNRRFYHFPYCAILRFVKYLGVQWSWRGESTTIRLVSPNPVE